MKTKTLILILLALFTLKGKCQFVLAGVQGQLCTDIAPDRLIAASGDPHTFPSSSYWANLNNDAFNDVRFTSAYGLSPGMSNSYINATALRSNVKLSLGRVDSVYNSFFSYWAIYPLLKNYSFLDTISPQDFNPIAQSYITNNENTIGLNYSSNTSAWWTGDKYVGISFLDSTSMTILYGWIKVEIISNGFLIKEHCLGSPLVGIKNIADLKDISVYPNPATDIITIKHKNKIDAASLIDVYGKTYDAVLSEKNEIDVSELAEGIYILHIKTKEGVGTKKVLVQR